MNDYSKTAYIQPYYSQYFSTEINPLKTSYNDNNFNSTQQHNPQKINFSEINYAYPIDKQFSNKIIKTNFSGIQNFIPQNQSYNEENTKEISLKLKNENFSNQESLEFYEFLKIQEKFRKFSNLFKEDFNEKFKNRFDNQNNSLEKINCINEKKFTEKNLTEKDNMHLINYKLDETLKIAINISKGSLKEYEEFCYLILRLKENSFNSKKLSIVWSSKLSFYIALNEKINVLFKEIEDVFRVKYNVSDINTCFQENPLKRDYCDNSFKNSSYLELLDNIKFSNDLKNELIECTKTLNEKINKMNSKVTERIAYIHSSRINHQIFDSTTFSGQSNQITIDDSQNINFNEDDFLFLYNLLDRINKVYENIEKNFNRLAIDQQNISLSETPIKNVFKESLYEKNIYDSLSSFNNDVINSLEKENVHINSNERRRFFEYSVPKNKKNNKIPKKIESINHYFDKINKKSMNNLFSF